VVVEPIRVADAPYSEAAALGMSLATLTLALLPGFGDLVATSDQGSDSADYEKSARALGHSFGSQGV
jgi:hypothetical protein